VSKIVHGQNFFLDEPLWLLRASMASVFPSTQIREDKKVNITGSVWFGDFTSVKKNQKEYSGLFKEDDFFGSSLLALCMASELYFAKIYELLKKIGTKEFSKLCNLQGSSGTPRKATRRAPKATLPETLRG